MNKSKNKNKIIEDYFYKFGYNCFGPLLISFSQWLKKELKKRNIKKVFFLARDGFVLKKAFDCIKDDDVDTKYFYASRRSIIIPSLWKCETPNEIFESIAFKKKIRIKTFFKKVGLDDYNAEKIIKKYNFNYEKDYEIEDIKNNTEFLDEVFSIIKENSKSEWQSFIKYKEYMNFNGKIAIVDIGWYGTMQKALEKICTDIDIDGFYMALVPESGYYNSEKYHGFISDKIHDKELYNKLHYFISIFEFLFLAQHGSVKRFNTSNEFVELYEYEYKDKDEKMYAAQIQKGGLEYVQTHKSDNSLDKEDALKNLFYVMLSPKMQDVKMFGDIMFVDDEKKYMAKPKSIIFYIFHNKKFIQDFKHSSWRIGFLKRLLKVKLPYYRINNLIRKIFLR